MSVFPWTQSTRSSFVNDLSRAETKFESRANFQVKGCVSPELGAHALVKVSNSVGFDFGSSVICLSHLLNSDPNAVYSSVMKNVSTSIFIPFFLSECNPFVLDSFIIRWSEERSYKRKIFFAIFTFSFIFGFIDNVREFFHSEMVYS